MGVSLGTFLRKGGEIEMDSFKRFEVNIETRNEQMPPDADWLKDVLEQFVRDWQIHGMIIQKVKEIS